MPSPLCRRLPPALREITPINELAPLPVRLNPVVGVRRDGVTIAQAPASFTLLDVLGEIYFEISSCGSPVRRAAFTADLLQAVETPSPHPA
jgi:hypothetical protein